MPRAGRASPLSTDATRHEPDSRRFPDPGAAFIRLPRRDPPPAI